MSNERTGISITSKKIFGQFLITSQPEIFVNEIFIKNLRWNKKVFVQLDPKIKHNIEISIPYMSGQSAQAFMNVILQEGEVMQFLYRTPVIIYSSGIIKKIN